MRKKYLTIIIAALVIAFLGGACTSSNSSKETESTESPEEDTPVDVQASIIPELKVGDESGWKITQYGERDGDRQLCYTITTDTQLVIVDGGWEAEIPRLREIISQYENHVDAWILTHPDSDHITAFNAIYADLQGIIIDNVYTPEYPSIEVIHDNASWDDTEALEEFRGLNVKNHTFLHRGDELDLIGLKMTVLSAYEDKIDEITDDLMNNGALLFKISGNSETMMFCGDLGSAGKNYDTTTRQIITDYIMSLYDEGDLKSDYIQMAHHGFQGMMSEFYQAVNPKAAFFDAPAWLLNGDNPEFSDEENVKLMTEMGSVLFTYYTTPNQILLR